MHRSQQRGENERDHLVQCLPIQASGYDRGQDAAWTVDKLGAKSPSTGKKGKDQTILQGSMVSFCID